MWYPLYPNVFSTLFCLPKKCGTTSYQRALSEHVTSLITDQRNGKKFDLMKKIANDMVQGSMNQIRLRNLAPVQDPENAKSWTD